MHVTEQLKKSGLFPEQIKLFLLECIENHTLAEGILQELETTLKEEDYALKSIAEKYT